MNILVTGAKGFVGRNLTENLKNIRDGKNQTRPALQIDEIYEYDLDTDFSLLMDWCSKADFIFHLAGVNRPEDESEYMSGNYGFTSQLLELLNKAGSRAPIMLSSSIQASLTGRFKNSEYGRSKKAGEDLLFSYGKENDVKVLIYRFPNLFGKWCKPNYNSAIATFCNNIAMELPIQVNDPATELELVYIDDLVTEMLDGLEGKEHHNGQYCYVPVSYQKSLKEIVELLRQFHDMPQTLIIPDIPEGSFAKKLYATYLSYLPEDKAIYDVPMSVDERGCFTELLKSAGFGQVSVNISKPGKIRGQHWHNSKWEIFMVVSGHGLIQERRIGIDPETGRNYPIRNYEVSGDHIQAVQMLPGYTHNIINLSETEDLITVMYANEIFDPEHPETYRESV